MSCRHDCIESARKTFFILFIFSLGLEMLYYYFFEQVFYTLAIFTFLFKYINSLQKEGFIWICGSREVRFHYHPSREVWL